MKECYWQTITYLGSSGKCFSRIAFPSRKESPLTCNPQAYGVADVRLEFMRVEPGLWEAAAEAGV